MSSVRQRPHPMHTRPQVGDLLIINQPNIYERIIVGYVEKEFKSLTRKARNDGVVIHWVGNKRETFTYREINNTLDAQLCIHVPCGVRVCTEIDTTEQK